MYVLLIVPAVANLMTTVMMMKLTFPDVDSVDHVALTSGSSRSRSSSDAERSKQHDSDIARLSALGGDIRPAPRDVIIVTFTHRLRTSDVIAEHGFRSARDVIVASSACTTSGSAIRRLCCYTRSWPVTTSVRSGIVSAQIWRRLKGSEN